MTNLFQNLNGLKDAGPFIERIAAWILEHGPNSTISETAEVCSSMCQLSATICLNGLWNGKALHVLNGVETIGWSANKVSSRDAMDSAKRDLESQLRRFQDEFERTNSVLKVLLISAGPSDLNPVEEAKAIRIANNAHAMGAGLHAFLRFRITAHPSLYRDELLQCITSEKAQVVSFFAHSNSNAIALMNRNGTTSPVSADNLARCFSPDLNTSARVVMLLGCTNAAIARKMSEHVPYVVGTLREINNDEAHTFSHAFLLQLAGGANINMAFIFASQQVMIEHTAVDQSAPFTLIRGKDVPESEYIPLPYAAQSLHQQR